MRRHVGVFGSHLAQLLPVIVHSLEPGVIIKVIRAPMSFSFVEPRINGMSKNIDNPIGSYILD